MGCSPSGTSCSSMGPQWTCQEPALLQAPHGVTASFRHSPTPKWGLPQAAGGHLHCGPPWTAGDSLPHCCLHHGLQGNLYSGAWSTSLPSFGTDCGICKGVSLRPALSAAVFSCTGFFFFLPFLKMLSQKCYHCCW